MEIEDRESIRAARAEALERALARQSSSVSRRRFLELLGASLALAGSAACARPRDQIVPYVAAGPLSHKLLKNGTLKT